MCIAVPCRLVSADGLWGEVTLGESRMKVRLDLVEDPVPGEWVLVHAGFAIERLDEDEATATLLFLREAMQAPDPPAGDGGEPAGGD